MAPDMLAKVKANHRKNADGSECARLCDTLGEKASDWGRCAEKPGSCSEFRECYEAANK